ncbi:retrovirus-related Pol polyprotein from transposon 17.6 [Trichonephila clavipes]|nr:retrovirus-related Pol polyprotein from transposon 17.6 [Trichonephila clavipes]
MTWFHSAVVQFSGARHHSKRKRRWMCVKGSTRIGCRDPKYPSAFVWFEKTQGPLVKVLHVPELCPKKQLAVRVHFVRCGGLFDDWSVKGVLSLVFIIVWRARRITLRRYPYKLQHSEGLQPPEFNSHRDFANFVFNKMKKQHECGFTNHRRFNTSRISRISHPARYQSKRPTMRKLCADTSKESDTKFLVREVSKFIHRFDLKEDISLYLKLFERQAQRLNINQENWVSHLLGLLPTEVSHTIAREPDDKANSYEHVKDLLLKRFKLTPEKFRQLFVTHQKAPEKTWIDFYHELNTYFNGWIDGLKIDTSDKLSDLIITDQLKRKTLLEFKEYYLDEWANRNSPVQLAEKLEEFEDLTRTLKQKSSSPFVNKQEFKFIEKNRRYEAPGKFEYNRKDKKFPASTNYNKQYEAPVTKYESVQSYQDSAQKGYYNKNYEKDSNHNASKHAQTNYSKPQKFKEPPKETCTLIDKEGLRTKEIFFGKMKITAFIDSGSTVSLLRENTSRRIMDPTKLSKNKMLLTGIGEAQVTTIGSFELEFEIDNENYSLTWHIVPADKLKFEAVIGSDLLEQASISFTEEGVKFNKYENHAQLMQISAENLQEEPDLRHVENRQIKKELEDGKSYTPFTTCRRRQIQQKKNMTATN